MNIRDEIVARRRGRIAAEGPSLGKKVPAERNTPLVPFGTDPWVICEIKRMSPSRGAIDTSLDPVRQAGLYTGAGIRAISVLTEEDHFKGSLEDLVRVKAAFPEAAVLRKDFLFDPEDIDVSYRAGADAVLLIASVLEPERLLDLHRRAEKLGMGVLVEVHTPEEVDKIRFLRPSLVGINARDLSTFKVDLLHPGAVKSGIDWKARVVFESGIRGEADARLAGSMGFDGILVGEAVVRDVRGAGGIIRGFRNGRENPAPFWGRIAELRGGRRPLVKICGLTTEEDVRLAEGLGADLLGFVFAPSPRRADPALLRKLGAGGDPRGGSPDVGSPPGGALRGRALRVGVVVLGPGEHALPPRVRELLAEGLLDAVQLHGEETAETTASMEVPWYKAIRPRGTEDAAELLQTCGGPRVLVDAFSRDARGGTGKAVAPEVLSLAAEAGPLWMAGGIGPDTVGETLRTWKPELIDASSRLEERPGKKSPALMEKFFKEIHHGG
jgi:indole-3-glycerol phosphate synthase/phosphoribosylanthranilate isomerase